MAKPLQICVYIFKTSFKPFFQKKMLNVENGWNAFINFENCVFNPEKEDFSDFIEMWNNRYVLKMDIFLFVFRPLMFFIK